VRERFVNWCPRFDNVFEEVCDSSGIRKEIGRSSVGSDAEDILCAMYRSMSDPNVRAKWLATVFAMAAKEANERGCVGFIVWSCNIEEEEQLAAHAATRCDMTFAVFVAAVNTAMSFEQKTRDVKIACEDEEVVKVQRYFADILLEYPIRVVQPQSGTRGAAIFVPYAALSTVPLMRYRQFQRQGGDGELVGFWSANIVHTLRNLWKYTEEVVSGTLDRNSLATHIVGLRQFCVRTLRYFSRTFTIALACTGHMRSEDWYDTFQKAVFGTDEYAEKLTPAEAQRVLAECHPTIQVPGANRMRDIVWNLNTLMEAHREASERERQTCLTGILCVVTGLQEKKLAVERKTGHNIDRNPGIAYSVNALVDGEWGAMAAGNAMVLARGVLELYNRLALHAGEHPISSADVNENFTSKNMAESAGMRKQGGDSYIGQELRNVLRDRPGGCFVKAAVPVDYVESVGKVRVNPGKNRCVKTYKFSFVTRPLLQPQKPGSPIERLFVWMQATSRMIRNDFESSLVVEVPSARHILEKMGPMIGHVAEVQSKYYVRPAMGVQMVIDGKEHSIPLHKTCVTACNLANEEILRCGDFGINTACECSAAAVQYRSNNQAGWMMRCTARMEDAPSMLDMGLNHLGRLARETKCAFDLLFRPIPRLHHRWATDSAEQERGADVVRAFNDAMNKHGNEVVRQVRERLDLCDARPSETRMLGVSSTPMLAAKMFGPWAFHFDLTEESKYGRYVLEDTHVHRKRREYARGIAEHTENAVREADVVRETERKYKERIAELERERNEALDRCAMLESKLEAIESGRRVRKEPAKSVKRARLEEPTDDLATDEVWIVATISGHEVTSRSAKFLTTYYPRWMSREEMHSDMERYPGGVVLEEAGDRVRVEWTDPTWIQMADLCSKVEGVWVYNAVLSEYAEKHGLVLSRGRCRGA
jgi:hypothetical protein